MDDFPASLFHSEGNFMALDRTRLVFACRDRSTAVDVEEILENTGLEVEFGDYGERVANTPFLYWLRDAGQAEIGQARFEDVLARLASILDWIGPVYRLGGLPGRVGLLCPLPHVLVVKPAEGLDATARDELRELLAGFDCFEVPEVSAQLSGRLYFMRYPSNPAPLYSITAQLIEHPGGLIAAVEHEQIAMLLPFLGPTNDPIDHDYLAPSHVDEAWALLDPADHTPIVVAVIDSGVDLTHPDLTFHSPGFNVDTPRRFLPTFPLAATDGRPVLTWSDKNTLVPDPHGTGVAGIIGMIHNNAVGSAGAGRDVAILPISFHLADNVAFDRAVNVASQVARVINMSFGLWMAHELNPTLFPTPIAASPAFDTALDRAFEKGCVLCAGAGNFPAPSNHPANHPKVIAVTTWDDDKHDHFLLSRVGPELSLAAPIKNLWTATIQGMAPPPVRDPDYTPWPDMTGGTTAACAVVAGIAALVVKRYPMLMPGDVRRLLERTAQKLGSRDYDARLHNIDLGFGVIDAFRALDFADVRIAHHPADDGTEPTPIAFPVTTACDIVIKTVDFASHDQAFAQPPNKFSGEVVAGVTNFVYVRVRNNGPAVARNVGVRARVVPHDRSPFIWADWRAVDLDHIMLFPDIGMNQVPTLAAGGHTVFKLWILAPLSTLLHQAHLAGRKYCVLVEVHAANDYAHTFLLALADDTALEWNRNNLARRDLLPVPLDKEAGIPFPARLQDAPLVVTTVQITRALDLLDVEIELVNLAPDVNEHTRLVRADPAAEALLVAHFAPQSLAEAASFEVPGTAAQFVDPSQPGAGQRNEPGPPTPPDLPIPRRLARPSRLSFRVPDDIDSLPYTLDGLLDWSRLVPHVNARAVSPAAARERRPDTVIEAPAERETALEVPYRLVISPNERSGWNHARHAVTHAGRTELWHTRLGVREGELIREDVAEDRTVRAIWSPDYRPRPSPAPPEDAPFRTSLAPDDRHQIVRLTSDFGIALAIVVGGDVLLRERHEPEPIWADRLMLSALGAWADLRGAWDLPVRVREREQLSVEAWQHLATQGRDHLARVVYAGYLYPTCHRASLIKTTERKLQTIGGAPVATLRQRFNVLVREPERSYAPSAYKHRGRENPFVRSIRVHTVLTPNLALPSALPGTAASFWIADGTEPFRFACTGIDVRGRPVDFHMSALFVRADDRSKHDALDAGYRAANPQWRASRVSGRSITFAPASAERPDSTTLDTETVTLVALPPVAPDSETPFVPLLEEATVRLPAVERLIASIGPQKIKLADAYLDAGVNAAALFAEVLSAPALQIPAERAGALATPNLTITGLSERLGPLGGVPGDLANGTFDPSSFFASSARLLGGIELSAIVDPAFGDSQFPVIGSNHEVVDGVPSVVTTLSFKPAVHEFGSFRRREAGGPPALLIDTVVRRPLVGSAAPEHVVHGSLSQFTLRLAGVISIAFDELRFDRRGEGGLEVRAVLPEDAIRFEGALEWIGELQKAIPTGLFGSGLSLDVQATGVRAGYTFALPPIEVGVLSIKNASISAGVFLPFLQDQARVRFAFCERHRPFQLVVTLFGGGGFLAIAVGMDGVEVVEASLEFGGAFSLNLGVASGSVEVMAGIYFKWERISPTEDRVLIVGYVRMGGAIEALGIITVSVMFYLGLSYQSDGKVRGQATLTVKVEIAMFSASVNLTVEKSFGGSAADPNFGQAIAASDWSKYAECFA
jgi:hypothetical protein